MHDIITCVNNKIIDKVEEHVQKYIIEIEACYQSGNTLIASLSLAFCLLDSLSLLYTKKNNISEFFDKFMGKNYKNQDIKKKPLSTYIYYYCRNPLLHNISLGKKIILTENQPDLHLSKHGDKLIINFETFFNDIKAASKHYFNAVKKESTLFEQFKKTIKKNGITKDLVIGLEKEIFDKDYFDHNFFSTGKRIIGKTAGEPN